MRFLPSQAQGANQTFEDAWILTNALSADDVDTSLRRYEQAGLSEFAWSRRGLSPNGPTGLQP